jgi:hypothetical protein
MESLFRAAFPYLAPACLALAGCSGRPAIDPAELERLRSQYVLAEEPDGALTVSEVRREMLGEEPPNVAALLEHGAAGVAGAPAEEHADDHAAAADKSSAEEPGQPLREEMEVVLVGVVGGIPNPAEQSHPEFPFAPGQAMFFLADPEAVAEVEEHAHHHAPGEECAFCAAHAADAAALIAGVTFFDQAGKVLPVDVRDLFGLQEKDVVVVKGTARAKTHGTLSVEATGLYVRR